MKTRTSLFVTCVLILAAAPAASTPVAHWRFDESPGATTAVASFGIVNGTLGGSAAFVSGGISGNAVSFSRATGDHVTMGQNFALSGTFSLVAWIKTAVNDTSIDTIILGRHDANSVNGYFVGMNTSAGYGTTDKAYFYPSANVGQEVVSTTSVNDGNWHLVVSVFDAGTARIYVDGGPAEDTSGPLGIGGNTAEFLVGAVWTGSATARYDGLVDEVQIYDTALTQSDVEFLLQNPGAVIPEPSTGVLLAVGAFGLRRAARRASGTAAG